MIKILAVVEKVDEELKISHTAGIKDLIDLHPKCKDCDYRKGIHGVEGNTTVFCLFWNRPVEKESYCSNYK